MKFAAACVFAAAAALANAADVVPNSYIVTLDRDRPESGDFYGFLERAIEEANSRESGFKHELVTKYDFNTFEGFHGRFSRSFVDKLSERPEIASVEQEMLYEISATQSPVGSYGLSRIDERRNQNDNSYTYPDSAGRGVTAYILDTGVRASHNDFGGRVRVGYAPFSRGDVNGHGSHVAGTVGGRRYGVAKRVDLVSVQVCNQAGRCPLSNIIGGVEYAVRDCRNKRKCVANMSLGGPGSTAIDNAVRSAINSGLTVVAAAGNDGGNNSCRNSPARVASLNVANSDRNDRRSRTSTYGSCISLFAPGTAITSAWKDSDSQTRTISGTSMASPHVAGAVALLLAEGSYTPASVSRAIIQNATPDVISGAGRGTPNRLLYVGDA